MSITFNQKKKGIMYDGKEKHVDWQENKKINKISQNLKSFDEIVCCIFFIKKSHKIHHKK